MELIKPIMFENKPQLPRLENMNTTIVEHPKKEPEVVNASNMGVDFSFFTKDSAKFIIDSDTSVETKTATKRGRPKKAQTKTLSDGSEIVLANDEDDIPKYQSNEPYKNSYTETDNLLRGAIVQIDIMNNDIKSELDQIRASKTLKKKYDYISEMSGTMSTLIGTKISAIRELNKSITDAHNLEIRRAKELKVGEEENDDKRLMDMYNAYISMPMGNYQPPATGIEMTTMNSGVVKADIGGVDTGYVSYLQNLTPAQNRMRLENDPNIQTVVVYDAATGMRNFEVMNVQTGEYLNNVSKPDSFLLDDITINLRNGVARNTNLDITYPLIVINGNPSIMEY